MWFGGDIETKYKIQFKITEDPTIRNNYKIVLRPTNLTMIRELERDLNNDYKLLRRDFVVINNEKIPHHNGEWLFVVEDLLYKHVFKY